MTIVKSNLMLVSPQGGRSYVIEDHTTDTGKVVRVEGLREDGDFEAQMLVRVPAIEAQMERETEAAGYKALVQSAEDKIQSYLSRTDLKKDAGLTDDELLTRQK